jgi:hypothetical protein
VRPADRLDPLFLALDLRAKRVASVLTSTPGAQSETRTKDCGGGLSLRACICVCVVSVCILA